jgi:protein phosphatase
MAIDPNDTIDFIPPPSAPPPAQRPAAEQTVVDLAAVTHPGLVRSRNEDAYLAIRVYRALEMLQTNLPHGCIPAEAREGGYGMLVADGVGGSTAGDVASRLAACTLIRLALDTPDWIMKVGEREGDELLERLAGRYRDVDTALKEAGTVDPELAGMCTTMTVAFNVGRDLFVGHVGDSRAYLCRGDDLHQLTRDHTYAQDLVNLGVIEPAQVVSHKFRHVLTRVVGELGRSVEADVQQVRLSDGDQVLLCTDGLTEMVDDVSIGQILRVAGTAKEACQSLVDLALANGGKDNVTVVLTRYKFVRGG